MVVVQVRQETLDMAAHRRGLTARPRGRKADAWRLRADSTTTKEEKEEEEEEEEEVEEKADIKSNNPHLTGGEISKNTPSITVWPVDSDASARPNSGEAEGTSSLCLTFTSSSEPGLIASRSCELKLTRRCGFLTRMEPSFGAATQEGPIGALSGLKFREKLLLAIANLAASDISTLRRCRPDRRDPPPDTSDQLRRSSGAQAWCSCSGAQASLGP